MAPILHRLSDMLASARTGVGGVVPAADADLVGQFAHRLLEALGMLTKAFTSASDVVAPLFKAALEGATACFAALPTHTATRSKVSTRGG